jgi:hypothetical protein
MHCVPQVDPVTGHFYTWLRGDPGDVTISFVIPREQRQISSEVWRSLTTLPLPQIPVQKKVGKQRNGPATGGPEFHAKDAKSI